MGQRSYHPTNNQIDTLFLGVPVRQRLTEQHIRILVFSGIPTVLRQRLHTDVKGVINKRKEQEWRDEHKVPTAAFRLEHTKVLGERELTLNGYGGERGMAGLLLWHYRASAKNRPVCHIIRMQQLSSLTSQCIRSRNGNNLMLTRSMDGPSDHACIRSVRSTDCGIPGPGLR